MFHEQPSTPHNMACRVRHSGLPSYAPRRTLALRHNAPGLGSCTKSFNEQNVSRSTIHEAVVWCKMIVLKMTSQFNHSDVCHHTT